MVDLSQLEAGDSVKLRCGGVAIIRMISFAKSMHESYPHFLYFNGHGDTFTYNAEGENGQAQAYPHLGPFDIIEIIKKPKPMVRYLCVTDDDKEPTVFISALKDEKGTVITYNPDCRIYRVLVTPGAVPKIEEV